MRLFTAFLFMFALTASPAGAQIAGSWGGRSPAAQPGGPMSDTTSGVIGGPRSALSGFDVSNGDYWSRCIGSEDVSLQLSIRSCSRLIGARHARAVTAAAYYYRARHYEELGDAENVQRDYERALELFTMETQANRSSPVAFYNRGGVLAHFREYDRALADYRHAAELNPDWDEPYYRMGVIAFERGDYATAVAEFDRAAVLDADDAYNHAGRCEARAAQRSDLDGAEAACAAAVRLSESGASTLVSRGYLRFMRGDIEAAYADFDAALEADADNLYAAYGRGVAGTRLERHSQAETDLARAADGLSERERAHYAGAGLVP